MYDFSNSFNPSQYASVGLIGLSIIIMTIVGATNIHSNYKFTSACVGNDENKHRLPRPSPVIPVNYTLSLRPNLADFTYNGTVDINVKVMIQTKCFFLNYEELDIHEVQVFRPVCFIFHLI